MIYKADKDDPLKKTPGTGDSGKRKRVLTVLLVVFAVVFLASAVMLIHTLSGYKEGRDEYGSLLEGVSKPTASASGSAEPETELSSDFLSPDYDSLLEKNEDYIGWLEVPGTNISYPMVYPSDNDYYMRRTFLGTYNFAGSIFIDYRTSSDLLDDHTIIYGHRMNDGTMFADLKSFLDPAFYAENKNIRIYLRDEILVFEVFAAREVTVTDRCFTFSFDNEGDYAVWLSEMADAGNYETSLMPNAQLPTVTLSTCVYNKSESRNIVQAQLVERLPLEGR